VAPIASVQVNAEHLSFLKSIEEKWQRRWREAGVFEPEPEPGKPKFFITFPYPYVNAYPHLGTAYTVLRNDIVARYKRMRGFNVLFPQAWHATGGPIVAAALRVREGDARQIEILRSMGIPEQEIPRFADPRYWVSYFTKEWRRDFERYGLSIDWRREFFTTYLNPPYSRFVQWQYEKLRERGLIARGSHPVVWCPKEGKVVGDHDRPDEYAGIGPEDVVIIKFRDAEGLVYPCLTYRPETIYGAVNLWVHPDHEYLLAEVDGERWVVGGYGAGELADQGHSVRIVGRVRGSELVGRFAVNPVRGWRIPVLPALFVDPESGTGVVMSVPAHAPFDYAALRDLKNGLYRKYGLDRSLVEAVEPVGIIELEGYGEAPAVKVVEEMGVRDQMDAAKLEDATRTIYSKEYYSGRLGEVFGDLAGKTVAEAKEEVVRRLSAQGVALRHYTLPRPVYCRCGARTHVKIVRDQWFLRYSDPAWKKLAHECIERMMFLPDEVRSYFHQQVDWYGDWACAHKGELGTPIPWDPEWVLESLSDSTIYMAYYVLAKYLQNPEGYGIRHEQLTSSFFDYVLLGRGSAASVSAETGIPVDLVERMRSEFLYWYPVDLRISGKDLMPNHLVFFIMHHVAIFPREHWPRGIGVNGWIMVGGEKMSKSRGNFILLRQALEWWGADATRFAEAYAGNSGLDDGNFEPEVAARAVDLLVEWHDYALRNYGQGRDSWQPVDEWFRSTLHRTLLEVEREMEEANFKNVVVKGFFNLQNSFRWYLRRCGTPNREILKEFIEAQTLVMAPITPHICEEIWEKIGRGGFIATAPWPVARPEYIREEAEKAEAIVRRVYEDAQEVIKLVKGRPAEVLVFRAAEWKYGYMRAVSRLVESGIGLREALRRAMEGLDAEKRREAGKMAGLVLRDPSLLQYVLDPKVEEEALRGALDFYMREFSLPFKLATEDADPRASRKVALPGRPGIIVEVER